MPSVTGFGRLSVTTLCVLLLPTVGLFVTPPDTAPARLRASEPFYDGFTGARRESVLYYDDGTPETVITGYAGQKLAVGFQAPPWVTHVAGIEFFIHDDGQQNPVNPDDPTTAPFTAWVWRPNESELPGPAANDGYVPFDWYECPEDTLVRVYLPEPVDITDPSLFPDGRFFVGMEWEHRNNPYIGVDTDPPHHGAGLRWNWSDWELIDGDVIIRAVVSAESLCVPQVLRVDAAGGGAYLTIQEAVDAAGPCDSLLVAPGLYAGPMNRGIDFGGKNIVLVAEGERSETVIDCEHQDRGFYFVSGEDESAIVDGFTVRNGSGSGGGIRCVNSWPTIRDCAFVDCDGGGYGGGAYFNNALTPSPAVRGCLFAGNTASVKGGAVAMDFSEPVFENCTFAENGAPLGVLSMSASSSPTLLNCIIALGVEGGAAYCSGTSTPTFVHSCFYGNAGGDSLCGYYYENIFVDPLFCNPAVGDYRIQEDSPCASENSPWGELVGAYEPGCEPTTVHETSWGAMKAMFR